MTVETLIGLALLLPLVAVILTGLFARRPNLRELFTLLIAGALFIVVASLAPQVFAGARPALTLFEVLPGAIPGVKPQMLQQLT